MNGLGTIATAEERVDAFNGAIKEFTETTG
jgi:hypothetical protein